MKSQIPNPTSVIPSPKKMNFPGHRPIQKFTHLISFINHLAKNQTRSFIMLIEESKFIPTTFPIQIPLKQINQISPQAQPSTKS